MEALAWVTVSWDSVKKEKSVWHWWYAVMVAVLSISEEMCTSRQREVQWKPWNPWIQKWTKYSFVVWILESSIIWSWHVYIVDSWYLADRGKWNHTRCFLLNLWILNFTEFLRKLKFRSALVVKTIPGSSLLY